MAHACFIARARTGAARDAADRIGSADPFPTSRRALSRDTAAVLAEVAVVAQEQRFTDAQPVAHAQRVKPRTAGLPRYAGDSGAGAVDASAAQAVGTAGIQQFAAGHELLRTPVGVACGLSTILQAAGGKGRTDRWHLGDLADALHASFVALAVRVIRALHTQARQRLAAGGSSRVAVVVEEAHFAAG